MKTIILCGGKGTRLREETEFKPKPMVLIGGQPILLHIMNIYAFYGHKDFIVCLGYRGDMIKDYFLTLSRYSSDFQFDMSTGKITSLNNNLKYDYKITFAETGDETLTAGRVKQALKYIEAEHFMVTYGDGVSNININDLIQFHLAQERRYDSIATMSAVHPSSKYGKILFNESNLVTSFDEKPKLDDYINGGFMVMNKKVSSYLREDEMVFETLQRLTADRKLSKFKHDDFWHCMDTMKDVVSLNELWETKRPWAVWEKAPALQLTSTNTSANPKSQSYFPNTKTNKSPKLKHFFENKKVLITGHTGFKGTWLAQILLNWNANIVGVSLQPHTQPNLFSILGLSYRLNNYFVDIRNFDELKNVFDIEKPEIVFHLAAQAIVRESYDDPLRTYTTNTLGTTNILEIIRQVKTVRAAVIITTDKVYEDQDWMYPYRETDKLGGYDPYSSSKSSADIICTSYIRSFFNPKKIGNTHNTLVGVARAGNVIGGGDWAKYRLVPDIIRSFYENNEKLIIRSPNAIRPWQHVLEPLAGYLQLAHNLYNGDTGLIGPWNFGPSDDSFITVEDLVKQAISICNKGNYEIQGDLSKHETNILKLDATKAKTKLKWQPRLPLADTLNYTFSWYKKYYEDPNKIQEFTKEQIDKYFEYE